MLFRLSRNRFLSDRIQFIIYLSFNRSNLHDLRYNAVVQDISGSDLLYCLQVCILNSSIWYSSATLI